LFSFPRASAEPGLFNGWLIIPRILYASTDGVVLRPDVTLQMAAISSFHASKCCHLVNENEAYAGAYKATSVSS